MESEETVLDAPEDIVISLDGCEYDDLSGSYLCEDNSHWYLFESTGTVCGVSGCFTYSEKPVEEDDDDDE